MSRSQQKLVIYKNGDFARGNFTSDNLRSGKVTYYSATGAKFDGSFKNGLREGPATIEFPNGKFEGRYKKNKKHGLGRLSTDVESYEGEYRAGLYEGYGRYSNSDGWLYEGFWTNGKKHGYGVELSPNSDLYMGEYVKGKKQGLGLMIFAAGGFYYGFFDHGERSGIGVVYEEDPKLYYFGFFKSDKKQGRGLEYYKDGSKFDGTFEENKRHGPGIMAFGTGAVYMGSWVKNQRHGKGRMEKEGRVTSGNWEYNRFRQACAVNLDEVLKTLYAYEMPEDMFAYLSSVGYRCSQAIQPSHEVNDFLKKPFIHIVRERTMTGLARGTIYRTLRSLVEAKTLVQEFIRKVRENFLYIPDHFRILDIYKDCVPKAYSLGEMHFKWIGVAFGDNKRSNFNFDQLVVTDDIIFGEGREPGKGVFRLDGMCLEDGSVRIHQKFSNGFTRHYSCLAGPNYIAGIDDQDKKVYIMPEQDMWKGWFIFDHYSQMKAILHYFVIKGNQIYGFGRDKLGIYVISGSLEEDFMYPEDGDSEEPQLMKIFRFSQTYVEGYKISYQGELQGENELRGYWHSGSSRGKFLLKKNMDYVPKKQLHYVRQFQDTGNYDLDHFQYSILSHILSPSPEEESRHKRSRKVGFDIEDRDQEMEYFKFSEKARYLGRGGSQTSQSLRHLQNKEGGLKNSTHYGSLNEKDFKFLRQSSPTKSVFQESIELLFGPNRLPMPNSLKNKKIKKTKKTKQSTPKPKPKPLIIAPTALVMVQPEIETAENEIITSSRKENLDDFGSLKSKSRSKSKKRRRKRKGKGKLRKKRKLKGRRSLSSKRSKSKSRSKSRRSSGSKKRISRLKSRSKSRTSSYRFGITPKKKVSIRKLKSRSISPGSRSKSNRTSPKRKKRKSSSPSSKRKIKRRRSASSGRSKSKGKRKRSKSKKRKRRRKKKGVKTTPGKDNVLQTLHSGTTPVTITEFQSTTMASTLKPKEEKTGSRSQKSLDAKRYSVADPSKSNMNRTKTYYNADADILSTLVIKKDKHLLGAKENPKQLNGKLLDKYVHELTRIPRPDPLLDISDDEERQQQIDERAQYFEEVENEARLHTFPTIVRRVCALRSLNGQEIQDSPGAQTHFGSSQKCLSELERVKQANFEKRAGREVLSEYSSKIMPFFDGEYQVNYSTSYELSWYGSMNIYGKEEYSVMEHLSFDGNEISGYFTFEKMLYTIKGTVKGIREVVSEDSKSYGFTFKMTATCTQNKKGFQMIGFFDKYSLISSLRPFPEIGPEKVIKLSPRMEDCTVFIQPENKIFPGKVRKSDHIIFTIFYKDDMMHILSGRKKKQSHGIIASLMTGPKFEDTVIVKEVNVPLRLHGKKASAFYDSEGKKGYIVEVLEG